MAQPVTCCADKSPDCPLRAAPLSLKMASSLKGVMDLSRTSGGTHCAARFCVARQLIHFISVQLKELTSAETLARKAEAWEWQCRASPEGPLACAGHCRWFGWDTAIVFTLGIAIGGCLMSVYTLYDSWQVCHGFALGYLYVKRLCL